MRRYHLLRLPEVLARTGLKKTTLYKLMAEKKFPSQIMLTERCVGWDEDAVHDWILSKLEAAKAGGQ